MTAGGTRVSSCGLLLGVCLACAAPTGEAAEGMVAYIHGSYPGAGTIHVAVLDSSGAVVSDTEVYGNAAHDPKFSPDGTRIAFVRDSDRKLVVMDLDGSNQQELITCAADNYPLGSWRHADRIYVDGGYDLLCYSFGSGNTTKEITGSGQKFRELDISVDLKGVHGGMPPVWAFDLNASTDAFAFSECGASISRDGTRVTNCRSDHQGLYIREWGTWTITHDIDTPTTYEALNPQFSGNSNDHVLVNVKNAAGKWNVWLYQISTQTWTQVTDVDVDNSVSDFYLGLPAPPEPVISLDKTTLSLAAVAGGADPSDQLVTVTNSGGGTLGAVSTAISYGNGSGWLTVGGSGAGNTQTLTNSIDISGLTADTYTATVTVSGGGASNSESYTVTLTVSAAAALTTITVTPSSADVAPSGSVQFTASAADQNGDPFPAVISWSVTGGGSMSPASSGTAVAQHSSTFTSSGATGTFTVRAASGGVYGEATVSVSSAPPARLRINCGTNSYTPAGWADDDAYVSGGSDYDFDGTWDTSAPGAAPESVYQTVRHLDHSYSFPGIPDGTYTVRIHFGDGSATPSRRMDYFIEGVQVLADFAPGVEAGGGHVALVKDFVVQVTDGDGLQIDARSGDGNDAFEAGIEIFDGGAANQAPTVDAGADQSVALGSSAFLFGSADDDGLPTGTLAVTWSLVSGPGDASFTEEHNLATNVTFTAVGTYTLRLTASDGELEDYDELQVTVTDEPSITLISPIGGEVWYIGTTRHVRWSTTDVDNVSIFYSSDNGTTADFINVTVLETDPNWGDEAWTIPAAAGLPSNQCKVIINKYNDDTYQDSSGTFEIRNSSDGDGDGMDDDWELATFGDMTHDQTTDADGDGATDYEEFMSGTDPLVPHGVTDSDSDGMDDSWERQYFGDLTHDGTADTDGDGKTDYQEFMAGTDPLVPDGGDGSGGSGFGCGLCRPSGLRLAGLQILALAALFFALVPRLRRFGEGR